MASNKGSSKSASSIPINRRKLLTLSATAAVGSLAGCSGDNDAKSKGKKNNTTLSHPSSELVKEANYNKFAGEAYNYTNAHMLFDKTAKNFSDGSIENYVLKDFSIDKNNVETWKFKKGFKWWNGKPLNAKDYGTVLQMVHIIDGEASPFKKVEVPDEYTIKAHRKKKINPSLRENEIAGTSMWGFRETYKPWLKKLQDANNKKEITSIQEELTNVKISHKKLMDDGLGNAPFKITKVENQRLVLEPFEDHPWADDLQLERFAFVYSEDANRRQKILNDEYDMRVGSLFPQNLRSQAKDYLQNVAKFGALWMWTLKLNWLNSKAIQSRGVRRAMAAAIDMNEIKKANSGHGIPIETQTGMDPKFSKSWLGKDLYGKHHTYPAQKDYEQAEKFLENTDFSRNGGSVVGPDGNPVKFNFIAGTGGKRKLVAQTVSAQLQDFGFKIDFQALSRNQFVNTYNDSMDKWDLVVESHYGGSTNHPLAYYNIDHMFGMILAHPDQGEQQVQKWINQGKTNSPYNGKPIKPTIPSEPGSLDVEGGEALNLYKSNVVLTESMSEKKTTEMTKKLARFWNAYLPDIDLIQRENGTWGDTKNFSFPSKDTPSMNAYRGPFYAIKKGQIGQK